MNRRDFFHLCAAGALPLGVRAQPAARTPGQWRTFEVTTRVEVLNPSGTTRVWVPAALIIETPYQRTLATSFDAAAPAHRAQDKSDAMATVSAVFDKDVPPVLNVTSRVMTRDHAIDLSGRGDAQSLDRATRAHFTRATRLLPTDGIVRATAQEITRGAKTELEKARAIYEWVVENTFRDPETRGCGLGDIRFMLETKDLGGKCADLNALLVGLARSVGLPARDVYGLRVAASDRGFKSLGTASSAVTRAQHCRAEVFLDQFGWVPVDPADVRKVALEEPPGPRPLDDAMVNDARTRLFGSWEMNWIAFNFAHDVQLPGSSGAPLPFFMYPVAETGGRRIDSLDPDRFRYTITAQEIA
jgi:transglutaminase-like putative cysteine protease